MASKTTFFGIILILLGVGGYFGSGGNSPTALIPAAFGLALVILGSLARDERKRKHAMHVAAMIGCLGFLGSARGLAGLARMLSGETVERPIAVYAQSIMAVLMAVFVGLCVKSFIEARRTRASA